MVYRVRPSWYKGIHVNPEAPEPSRSAADLTVYWGCSETLSWKELLATYEASRGHDHLLWFKPKELKQLIAQGFHTNLLHSLSTTLPSTSYSVGWRELLDKELADKIFNTSRKTSDLYKDDTDVSVAQTISWKDLLDQL
jgi:hypothetical protein